MITASTMVICINKKPNLRMPVSKAVSSAGLDKLAEILPNTVSFPVNTAIALPEPLTILVPSNKVLVLFEMPVSAATIPISFSAGYVSPVSVASFTCRSFSSNNKQSAGIISPAAKISISPGATSSVNTLASLPSRNNFTLVRIIERSASTALPACLSCIKLIMPVANRINRIIITSEVSPNMAERITAATNKSVNGLLNCEKNRSMSLRTGLDTFLFSALAAALLAASFEDNPVAVVCKLPITSAALYCQKEERFIWERIVNTS